MPKQLWHRLRDLILGRFHPEERKVFKIQMLLLFVLSTLLYMGFPGTREWRRQAEEHQMQTVMRGWDGLAWYVWLAAAPLMLLLVRRYPFVRGRIRQSLGPILLGSLILYLIVTHVRYFLRILPDLWWRGNAVQFPGVETYAYNTFGLMPLDLLTYCGFFAVSLSVEYYYKQRRQAEQTVQLQLQAVQLQSDLARAELAALRNQLHPHFLFNSFNALATLVRQRKNDAAVEIITKLSALLRLAIERTGVQEIPLEQEIDFIRRYLEIEHLRFGDKLRVDYALDPDTLRILVPHIVLQPLVENAIKHGISLRTSPGCVQIAAARAADRLHIAITDDGPEGPPPACATPAKRSTGVGLKNIRAQLDKLYGSDYRLEMVKRPEGGTQVRLDLPWREALVA